MQKAEDLQEQFCLECKCKLSQDWLELEIPCCEECTFNTGMN